MESKTYRLSRSQLIGPSEPLVAGRVVVPPLPTVYAWAEEEGDIVTYRVVEVDGKSRPSSFTQLEEARGSLGNLGIKVLDILRPEERIPIDGRILRRLDDSERNILTQSI